MSSIRIPEERKKILKNLSSFLEKKIGEGKRTELVFICTHNSRRSHMAQLWAQAAAAYYGIPNVIAYSGGTEVTAFNSRAVKTMEELGFRIRPGVLKTIILFTKFGFLMICLR